MQRPIIVFNNINKAFGKKKVITDLSLSIHAQEVFGIVGKSGAGKSTLLKMLIGIYSVDSGTILFRGKNITNTAAMKHVIGVCTQENSFYPELTVLENLWYYGKLYAIPRNILKEKQKELLNIVGIAGSEHVRAEYLSGGTKRRLDFAISLLHNPQLLILDEPTTGLDPITEKQIWELIHKLAQSGVSIIVISHMLAFVEKYCDTVGFLDEGTFIVTATPKELRKKYPKNLSFAEIFIHILTGTNGA